MKNQKLHIVGTLLLGVLVFVSGYLTYSGLTNDFGTEPEASQKNFLVQGDGQNCASMLDTARYFEEPCYEFTHYEKSTSHNGLMSDALSKTILKVANDGENFEAVEPNMVKNLAANASLNIMLETYTVSRLGDTCEQYLVTVESFTTKLEKMQREMSYFKPSASLNRSDMLKLKDYLDQVQGQSLTLVRLDDGRYVYQ